MDVLIEFWKNFILIQNNKVVIYPSWFIIVWYLFRLCFDIEWSPLATRTQGGAGIIKGGQFRFDSESWYLPLD